MFYVKCFMTLQTNRRIFFVAKMREAFAMIAKASHIFSKKKILAYLFINI